MVYDLDLDKSELKKLDKVTKDKDLSKVNKEIILRYIREAKLGKTILKGQKKKIGAGRNIQTISYLNMMCKDWFKKDLDKVTDKDMENFILALESGKITSNKGTPYKSETQSNIKKFIRKFYKWLIGDGYTFPKLVNWIDTSKQDAQINAIPELDKGVQKIIELIPDIRRKALIHVLFDSGFRIGELLSVTIADVEKRKDGIYYITCTESKTKRRTVSLNLSSDLLTRWLDQHPKRTNPKESLFLASRSSIAKLCKRYGKRALNIHVNPHMFRHTSATFYAPQLNRTHFCKRFGWSYNSQSPDRYIDFAKIEEEKIIQTVKNNSVIELKREFEEELTKERIKYSKLVNRLEHLEKHYDKFFDRVATEFNKEYDKKEKAKINRLPI